MFQNSQSKKDVQLVWALAHSGPTLAPNTYDFKIEAPKAGPNNLF